MHDEGNTDDENNSGRLQDQFARTETTWSHLELLSDALHLSNTRIKELMFPTMNAQLVKASPALLGLFSGLTTLSFSVEESDLLCMEGAKLPTTSPITVLIQVARPTLRKLEFRRYSGKDPCPSHIHYLEKLFSAAPARSFGPPTEEAMNVSPPLTFPNLTELVLRELVLSGPFLNTFLRQQPALRTVKFDYVWLATGGLHWSHIAASLPPTCTSLCIAHCGESELPQQSYVRYFKPYQDILPISCGWRPSEAYFARSMDDWAKITECKVQGMIVPQWEGEGRTKEEWLLERRLVWQQGEYERV